jgi:transmembrane sensor
MSANPSITPSDEQRRLELAAAEWLVKHDRGFTPAEQDEYFQWLAADPRHGEWLALHRTTWQELNALAQWRPEHSTEPNPDLLAPTTFNRHRARVVWFWSGALAAAAGLALVFTVWNQPKVAAPLANEPAQLTAQAYERRVLEDGSIIELNRGTRLVVDYTTGERRVRLLQGEALFTVAKSAARPFIVHVAGIDVRAIGTAFNVRLGAENVEVLVTQGRVQVAPPVRESALAANLAASLIPVLEAGDSVIVPLAPTNMDVLQVIRVNEDEVARQLAWQPKLLDFQSTPLAEVVAEFNRHGGLQLIIADAALESLPIVLSFRSDNVEGFVRLLELTADVRAERRGNALVLRQAK